MKSPTPLGPYAQRVVDQISAIRSERLPTRRYITTPAPVAPAKPVAAKIKRTHVRNRHGQYKLTIRHAPFDADTERLRAELIRGFQIAKGGGA